MYSVQYSELTMNGTRKEAGDNDKNCSEHATKLTPAVKYAPAHVQHIPEPTPHSLAEDVVRVCMSNDARVTCSAPAISQTPATPATPAMAVIVPLEVDAASPEDEAIPVAGGGYSLDFRKTPLEVNAVSAPVAVGGDEGVVGVATDKVGVTEMMQADELVQERKHSTDWDPKKILDDLYKLRLMKEPARKTNYINMEGFMEKLPINKKKSTLLKTWKRRYFRAMDGILYYYENEYNKELVHGSFLLANGKIEDLGNRILGIDDSRGHYLLVKIAEQKDMIQWKRALQSQTAADLRSIYVRPLITSHQHEKKVVIIDIGSCSVRAGILRQQCCLPELFFPTVCSEVSSPAQEGHRGDKTTTSTVFGVDALSRENRIACNGKPAYSYPIRPTTRQDKSAVDVTKMKSLLSYIFSELKVNPSEYMVMISTPSIFCDSIKQSILDVLLGELGVCAVNLQPQSSLVLYAYTAKSGVVVDCGERLDVVPVNHGYVVQSGVAKQPYGGEKLRHHFRHQLTKDKYHFYDDVESYVVRYAMEKLSFVSENFLETLHKQEETPSLYRDKVNLKQFDMIESMPKSIYATTGRFESPEGLFNPQVWGLDNKSIQQLVADAVKSCSMDMRKDMWRSIYLSGGVTQCIGFAERLKSELKKIAPPTCEVEVHASPHRYHSAYLGASIVAGLRQFESTCISREEWTREGNKSLRKWHEY